MARRKREPYFSPTVERTLERIAIAALAAIATRAEGADVARAALIIFLVVAVVEELGRGFVVGRKRHTLRDLVAGRIAKRRLSSARNKPGIRSSTGGNKSKRRRRKKSVDQAHKPKS